MDNYTGSIKATDSRTGTDFLIAVL